MNEAYFLKNPKLESPFSDMVLSQARDCGKRMIENGDDIMSLSIGDQREAYFLSRSEHDVIGSQTIEIDGVTFFLGMKRDSE